MNSETATPPGDPVPMTDIILITGDRYRVEGDSKRVERIILDAARGSIMQLAWLVEADTGDALGVNPESVVLLRTARAEATAGPDGH